MDNFGAVIDLGVVSARGELNVNKGRDEESEVVNEHGALGTEAQSII